MIFKHTIATINSFISRNLFNGAVIKITHHNQSIFFETFGYQDKEHLLSFKKDNVFALYSMTKPVTIIAALKLIQENKLSLATSVKQFYPDFNEDMSILQLLNMTSGLSYFWNSQHSGPLIRKVFNKVEQENISLQKFCQLISKIPADNHPGTQWQYGIGLDILGGIIEQVTNMDLADFCHQTIFAPLEMWDTAFYVKDASKKTLVYDFIKTPLENKLVPNTNFAWLMPFTDQQPKASLGGSGLFSTADDYAKFLNMLLTGTYKDQKIIDFNLLEQMRQDQLHALRLSFKWTYNQDYTYGFGVRVREKNQTYPLTEVGEFGWDGALGSAGLVDPKNNLTMTFLTSSFPGNNKIVQTELFAAVYQDLRANKII